MRFSERAMQDICSALIRKNNMYTYERIEQLEEELANLEEAINYLDGVKHVGTYEVEKELCIIKNDLEEELEELKEIEEEQNKEELARMNREYERSV